MFMLGANSLLTSGRIVGLLACCRAIRFPRLSNERALSYPERCRVLLAHSPFAFVHRPVPCEKNPRQHMVCKRRHETGNCLARHFPVNVDGRIMFGRFTKGVGKTSFRKVSRMVHLVLHSLVSCSVDAYSFHLRSHTMRLRKKTQEKHGWQAST